MYLLNEFGRTVGAKDKKDRKRRGLQIAGGIAGAALLGGLAIKNKGKLGQLFKKKVVTNVAKETPKSMSALPAAGQSNSPLNNKLTFIIKKNNNQINNGTIITPANLTKKEFNTSKVAARKEALGEDLNRLKNNITSLKKTNQTIKRHENSLTNVTEEKKAFKENLINLAKTNKKSALKERTNLKSKVKSKVQDLRKSNPSMYHLNKLIEFSKICTY